MAAYCMNEIVDHHIPVLLNEAIANLITTTDGIYVDATFGRGSHSKALLDALSAKGRLISLDKDPEAILFAKQYFSHDARFSAVHSSFARLSMVLNALELNGQINGILFDLGVSSPQLDNPLRGFSFSRDGNLDMRMDNSQGIDAAQFLQSVSESELVRILFEYGEEKHARRIAKAILRAREEAPITSTKALADIIKFAIPKPKKREDKHPATRSFQAIRIAVNQELSELEQGLAQALEALAVGGRLAVISFHSLEDRMVKQFVKYHEKGKDLPRGLPIKASVFPSRLKTLGKAIKPCAAEINFNQRARSAILRIAEKQL
jgi:16S rRNA (cytosine1402-N4)-methyltransferase